MSTITVEPTLTITRPAFTGNVGRYKAKDYTVTSIELDENINMHGEPLHVVHLLDQWGQHLWCYETSDSLKALFDVAVSND